MPSTVQWSIEVAVAGGPVVEASSSFHADAYAVHEVTAAAGGSATEPFVAAPVDDVDVLMITASQYHPSDLTYTLGGEVVVLDQPQLYVGAGQLGRFGADLSEITVDNGLGDDVTVMAIVVQRS
jgi:hypothetical protein